MKVQKSTPKGNAPSSTKNTKSKNAQSAEAPVSKLTLTLALIVAAIGAVFYIQTLSYDFVLDDFSAIKENRVTKQGTSALGEIFKTTYRHGYTIQGDELYRPIPKAIFACLWQWFPDNPFPGHLLNVLCYAFTGFMLVITLSKFMGQKNVLIAFIASALFIAHPIHTEVTANIKSLDEILGFLFFIISLYFSHSYLVTSKNNKIAIAAAFYFLALLCKESSITFIGVFPLMFYFFGNNSISSIIKTTAILFVPALVFLVVRSSVIGFSGAGEVSTADNLLMATDNMLFRKTTAIFIMGLYLKLMVAPIQLAFDYSYSQIPIVGPGDWRFLLSFAILITMAVYAALNFKKKNIAAFGILYFFITASLSSNVFMIIGTSMGERLMYAPSFGICLLLAWLIVMLGEKIKPAADTNGEDAMALIKNNVLPVGITMVIIAVFGIKTFSQNPVWKNNMTLYESGVKVSPNSTRTQYYLGNAITKPEYMEQFKGDSVQIKKAMNEGIAYLKRAVEIYPGFTDPLTQLGVAYYKMKDYNNAYKYYEQALKQSPGVATIHNNMGTLMFETGQYENALKAFEKAIQLDPFYSDAYNNAGSAYGTMGKYDQAINMFTKCTELDPVNVMAWKFLGITYQNKGDAARAKQYLDKAASLEGKN